MALWRAVQSDPVMKKCEEDMALLGKAPTWIKGGELVLKPDIAHLLAPHDRGASLVQNQFHWLTALQKRGQN